MSVLKWRFGRIGRHSRTPQRGASMVESLIALPIIILLMLGAGEWARIYEAKTILDHAAVMGARAGALEHASLNAIQRGVAQGMLPLYAPPPGRIAATEARLLGAFATQARVRILNPTPEAFQDFGEIKDGRRIIPNQDLHRKSKALGARSGINIQDANLLKIEVTWGLELRMPFVGPLIALIGERLIARDAFERQLFVNQQIPILSTTVLRMQSPAHKNGSMVSIDDQQGLERRRGGPVEQLAGNDREGDTGSDGGRHGDWIPASASGGYTGNRVEDWAPVDDQPGGDDDDLDLLGPDDPGFDPEHCGISYCCIADGT